VDVETAASASRSPPRNEYGVLDHAVVTPTGETVYLPVRAIADSDGCEVVFTLRRLPGMTDADFDRDARRGVRRPRAAEAGRRGRCDVTTALTSATYGRGAPV
jgi:hypothetical protein